MQRKEGNTKTFSTTWQCTTSCNPQSHLYCFVAQVILCLHLYHIYSPTTTYVNQWVWLKRQWSRSRRCSSAEVVFHCTITSYWDHIWNSFGSLVSIKAFFEMTRKFWFLAVCFYSTLTSHMWKDQGKFDFSFHDPFKTFMLLHLNVKDRNPENISAALTRTCLFCILSKT